MKTLFALILTMTFQAQAQATNVQPLAEAIHARECELGIDGRKLSDIKVLVGIGNADIVNSTYPELAPDQLLGRTKHNIGLKWIQDIADQAGLQLQPLPETRLVMPSFSGDKEDIENQIKFLAAAKPKVGSDGKSVEYSSGGRYALFPNDSKYRNIVLLQPLYDINASGVVIDALIAKSGLKPNQFIIIGDSARYAKNEVILRFGPPPRAPEGEKQVREGNGVGSIVTSIGNDFYRLNVGISNPQQARKDTEDPRLRKELKTMKLDQWVLLNVDDRDRAVINETLTLDKLLAAVNAYVENMKSGEVGI